MRRRKIEEQPMIAARGAQERLEGARLKIGVTFGGRSTALPQLTRCCLSPLPKPAIQVAKSGRPSRQPVACGLR